MIYQLQPASTTSTSLSNSRHPLPLKTPSKTSKTLKIAHFEHFKMKKERKKTLNIRSDIITYFDNKKIYNLADINF